MTYNLLKGLKTYQDIELSAIILNECTLAEKVSALGVHVLIIDENKNSFTQILGKVRKSLKTNLPDIVHSHRYKENLIAYLASKSGESIRRIATQHGMPEMYGEKRNLKHKILSKINFTILSKYFHAVVAVSKDIQSSFIRKYKLPPKKVGVIHNGVEIPERLYRKKGESTFVIGSTGRLVPVKDYLFMVEIAREFLQQPGRVRFELAGDGPEIGNIMRSIQQYGLEKSFILHGFVSNMSDFYHGLDLYMNTSMHEGIPMSVLEAMAHGVPVIAPRVGGLMEIIDDGVNGYLVEGRDARDFASRCVSLYENDMLRKQMGSAARNKIISEFSVDQMAQKYYNLYLDVCKTH